MNFYTNHVECFEIMDEYRKNRNLDVPCIDTILDEDIQIRN